MSKLIIKQDLPPPSAQERLVDILQVVLPIILLVIAISAAVSLYVIPADSDNLGKTTLSTAIASKSLPSTYLTQESELQALALVFDDIAQNQAESYEKNALLTQKAEALLTHVNNMDALLDTLALDAKDKQVLLTRHQHQKDYWESKMVFHRLRMGRFATDMPAPVVEVQEAKVQTPAVAAPVNAMPPVSVPNEAGDSVAQPSPANTGLPPGVQLPPGMCPLFGPGAAECKAGKQ
ncbi:hypothetical protein [Candidatus Thiothrix anitrata]|jgi:hypothetical protein|uniref:Uncharacterized protein n=1 Tax=Candidatus Thiothrix anitrata TaxID=2823902 RepID=A0ABX7X2K7_9GAMM|nr:hypothetical protein [Candidatus Thiothrix anitrata]QTR49986.1 hypothetical protein J8380_17485 [Candidatus Thiothrix anitrata]